MEMAELGIDAIPAIAALGRRALIDAPSPSELHSALTAVDQPAMVRGDPALGVVATVIGNGRGFVRFIAVDPDHRGQGLGRELLTAAEEQLRASGTPTVTIGADAPNYLWAGIDTRELAMVCLAERMRYSRVGVNLNMEIDLTCLADDPGGWRVAGANDRDAVAAWAEHHWAWWAAEMLRACDQGGLVIAEDDDGIAAVCAHDVTRAGLVGPVAVRPDLMGRGVGAAPLMGALHRMLADGRTHVEVSWVGPVVPYARVGATFGRAFLVYRKHLK
jgi:predicted N-acetyltransferase YhbS